MNRLKLIAGVLLIFFTGIAAGHFGTVFYLKNIMVRQGPTALHHLVKKKISRELRLTPRQQIKFNNIVSQAEKEFNSFRREHRPELEQKLNACFEKISKILTPDQEKRFNKIKKRFKRRFHRSKRFSPHHPSSFTDNQPQ